MAKVVVRTSKAVDAPPEQVLAFLRDYRQDRPRILTSNYTDYRVQEGGEGAGTVIAYHFAAGRFARDYRLRVQESDGVLEERDELSSFLNTWTVTPSGAGSNVTIEASWDGARGIGGFFERTFAPRTLGRINGEVLERLAASVSGAQN